MNSNDLEFLYQQLQHLRNENGQSSEKYKEVYNKLNQLLKSDNQPTLCEEQITKEDINKNLSGMISESQAFQLKSQIIAYKHLIRNMILPRDIEKNISTFTPEQWDIEKERLMMRSLKNYNERTNKYEKIKLLYLKRIREQQHHTNPALGQSRKIFIECRKEILRNLLKQESVPHEKKVKLEIELRSLEQEELYTKIKTQIFGNLSDIYTKYPKRLLEKYYLNRNFFRREKPKTKNENRMIEKFEAHLKNEQEHRKKSKQRELLTKVLKHTEDFFDFHTKKYKIMKKMANRAKAFIETAEKKEQEKRDRDDRERVKALKEKNFDAYIDLVQKNKNKKILEILKNTDRYLKQIINRVHTQKGTSLDDLMDEEMKNDLENIDDFQAYNSTLNMSYYNKIYYDLTHSIKEDIKEQPMLLENGMLKSYQLAGLSWLVSLYNNNLNGILADEMGLGKTIQTIALFCYIIEVKKNFGPFMIVVPLTTLPNWVAEFDKWAPAIKKIVYKGNPQERKLKAQDLKNTKWNVCLTTYEYILKDRLVLNKMHWQYIVVDEGHRMKNSQSKFAQTLAQQYTSEHRLLLTGTPLQNNLPELWSLLNFLLPKVFENCDDFDKWFAVPLNKISTDNEATLNEEEKLLLINRMHQVLRPFLLRRVKMEVESELPNKVEHVIKVELSAWQQIIYKQIQTTGSLARDPLNGKIGTKTFMNLIMQLRKICNHPYLFLHSYSLDDDVIWRSSGKFEILDRILPKLFRFGHRILIFTQMTHLLDVMEDYFAYRGFKYLRLDGSTKAGDRETRMTLFNGEGSDYSVFLLSTRAGGLGLNLQTADTVILFDSDWNPQMDLQAQDRAHRIGQKSEVRVFRFITNTWIEEEILSKAAFKMSLDEVFIQAGLYNQKATDTERKERLEEFLKRKSITEDLHSGFPTDEQLNEMLARDENELRYFNEMDQERYSLEKNMYKHFVQPVAGSEESFNYRLLQENEVPEWVKIHKNSIEEKVDYGRGNRVRKQISYLDDMDDDAYFDMMGGGKDVITMPAEEKLSEDVPRGATKHHKVAKVKMEEEGTPKTPTASAPAGSEVKKMKRGRPKGSVKNKIKFAPSQSKPMVQYPMQAKTYYESESEDERTRKIKMENSDSDNGDYSFFNQFDENKINLRIGRKEHKYYKTAIIIKECKKIKCSCKIQQQRYEREWIVARTVQSLQKNYFCQHILKIYKQYLILQYVCFLSLIIYNSDFKSRNIIFSTFSKVDSIKSFCSLLANLIFFLEVINWNHKQLQFLDNMFNQNLIKDKFFMNLELNLLKIDSKNQLISICIIMWQVPEQMGMLLIFFITRHWI